MGFSLVFVLFSLVSMECRLEQRAAIKMCVRTGETLKMTVNRIIAAWPGNALSPTQIRFWFRHFQKDPTRNTKDMRHTGRKRSQRVPAKEALVLEKLDEDKRCTVRELAAHADMSKSSMHQLLRKDMKMHKLAPKFIPKVLTQAQKDTRVEISRSNLAKLEADPGILAHLIATDESWIFTYDPRTKRADMEWTLPGQPRPRKALHSCSQRRTLLILYFDSYGPILCYFYDEGTVDSEVYIDSLRMMRENLRRKRPERWAAKDFLLLQDNASPHTSIDTAAYLFTVDMAEMLWSHPQYSLDLSPCDYWAFPVLKNLIIGHRFQSLDDVKTCVQRILRDLPLAEFQNCFDNLMVQYRKCVAAAGEYFEGQGNRGLAPAE